MKITMTNNNISRQLFLQKNSIADVQLDFKYDSEKYPFASKNML